MEVNPELNRVSALRKSSSLRGPPMVKPLRPVKLSLPLSLVAAESEELLLFGVPNCTRDDVDLERYLLAFLPAGLQVQGV